MFSSASCPITPSAIPYTAGVWLWGAAAVLGGTWTVTVTANHGAMSAPPPATWYSPPPTALPSPNPPPPSPAANFNWQPDAGKACSASGTQLMCDGGAAADATSLPADQTAWMALPAMGGDYYIGLFMQQAQTFSGLGFPASLTATDQNRTYALWTQDLPNTPSGESCQAAGDDCPNGTLTQAARPTAAAALLPAIASKLIIGWTPNSVNS